MWWTFTTGATQAGVWHIDTCGSGIDSVLTVYSGACGTLTEVACNDDAAGNPCSGPRSAVTVTLAASTTYKVRVASKGSSSAGQIPPTLLFPPPPSNDNCAAAALIPWVGTGWGGVIGTNNTAILDGANPTTGCAPNVSVDRDVWYSFTPNATASW